MDINMDLLQWFVNFLTKKISVGAIKIEIMPNQQLPEELHKPIIRKIENDDLADMRLINKFKK